MPYLASLSTVSTTTPGAPFVATPAVTAPTMPAGIPTQATTVPATTATVPTTAPAPVFTTTTTYQKIDDDSLTGWKRKNLSVADYPKLTNDTNYVPWKIKFTRQVSSHFWFQLIDPKFSTSSIRPGSDQDLFDLQLTFFSMVLDAVLLTEKGKMLARK